MKKSQKFFKNLKKIDIDFDMVDKLAGIKSNDDTVYHLTGDKVTSLSHNGKSIRL